MFRLCGVLLKNQLRPLIALTTTQNISYTHLTPSPRALLSKRFTSTSLGGPGGQSNKNEEKITPYGWLLMLVPVVTFGLGCWQVKRKAWKEQLINDIETFTTKPPVELPENLSNIKDMEYHTVKVKGKFLHEKEMMIGPRSFVRPDGVETLGGLISQRDSGNGYWVITPFKLADRDDVVLINRGWIPRKKLKPESRLAGQITDEVEMTCVVRKEESKPLFTTESRGDLFLYRDITKMCALTGAQPVFLDASYDSSVPGGPIGGQTHVILRNDHLSYTITWYGLSLATAFLWYRIILKGKPI